jgi:hypothetical protein
VDHGAAFEGLLSAMDAISSDLPLVFPVHPRGLLITIFVIRRLEMRERPAAVL